MDRILLASDLTARSHEAIARACRIARQHQASLRIVHVLKTNPSAAEQALARTKLHDQVEPQKAAPQGAELEFAISILGGDPAAELLAEARTFAPDLVVIGGHETPRLRDVLFGTTATHLLQQLDAPLLAVRGDAGTPYRRLLIALEGDEEESLLQAASAIAKPSEIFVVHATGSQLEIVSGDADLAEADEDLQTRRVREALAASGLALADVHVHTVCRDGEPLDLIGRSWAEARPDLLVMGTHGRSGIGRMLHGSRADAALIGYPADILVMRSRSPA